LFVAVWPPAGVVAALARWDGDVVRTAPAKLHVTLRFLGEVASWTAPDLVAMAGLGPVVAQLGPATSTFGRGVLHVPVAGLSALAAVVDPTPERPFVGHLTLRRGRDVRRWAGLAVPAGAQVPWPVEEVTLVRSAEGRYTVMERLPLVR
jgi:2'-5' RNA ligase